MSTFGQKLNEIREASSDSVDRGTRFEHLFMKLARTEPDFGISDIWKWSDWPEREQLTGLDGRDIGIDLVAKSITNDYIAIQCKCFAADRKLSKKDLDSFFSFSGVEDVSADKIRQVFDTQWVISTCDWTSNADNFVKKQGKRMKRIDFSEFEQCEYAKPSETRRQVRRPFDFQNDAIVNCVQALYYSGHNRGRLVMACGTGKTFVALRVAEKIAELSKNRLVLFLAPSIALVSQARREWLRYTQSLLLPLVVCSDRTAGGKDEDISIYELKCKVTTDPEEISEFANGEHDSLKVIFCTYQSLQKVVDAQQDHGMAEFGLTVADEAHRTTGVLSQGSVRRQVDFQLMHDGEKLQSARRMYMTATPRVYDEKSVKRIEQKGYDVVDMGGKNADFYGLEMYRIGFGEAVSLNRLSEYRVIVLGVSAGDVSRNLKKRIDDIEWEGKGSTIRPTVGELVRVLGTSLAINGVYELVNEDEVTEPLRKVLAFSNSIARSKWYTKVLELNEVKRATTNRMTSGTALKMKAKHIDGRSSAKDRYTVLRELENATENQETCIVNNVKLFTEGVDVPSLDAVVFLDPRDSQVDVVQAVGRVMRKAPGKKYGYIVVPVILNDQGNWLQALESGNDGYQTIGRVLRALQAHDSRLAEEPEKLVHVIDARSSERTNGYENEELELGLLDSLKTVDQNIYAKVVATSRLGRPGQMVADQIASAVKYAASVFRNSECVPILADKLEISIAAEKDTFAVSTIAALLLCNACLMHKRLKSTVPEMKMLVALDKLNVSSEPIGQLSDIWSTILEKDYKAIFAPALAILKGLREHGFTDSQTHLAIRPLIECANQVADSLSELGYDHAGPLYHQILPSAQSDGAFYTNNLSALMLARLTLSEDYIDWSDLDAVRRLRIMDPACGTGTLLLAICKTLKDRVKAANPGIDISDLHKQIVENMVCGLDINHHAVQLAGCNLTLGAPTIDYDRINVARVRHGTKHAETDVVQLGSLELLDMSRADTELSGVAHDYSSIDELGAESAGGGKIDFPHSNLDVVIMNPPFTNNTKRGKKFTREVQDAMRKRERDIRDRVEESDELAANSIELNSIQTFFTPLADRLTSPITGTLSQILPTTALIGTSARPQRDLLQQRFDVQYVVTSHDPNHPNFSENTRITESLLVCRRKENNKGSNSKFVNLKRLPRTPNEAIELSDAIEKGELRKWGEQIEWDREKFEQDDWCACLFMNPRLAEIASELAAIEPAGQAVRGVFRIASELAAIEPAGRRTQDGFEVSTTETEYRALWNHKSELRQTLWAEPDSIIDPKPGKTAYAKKLWAKRSRLLVANRLRTTNVRTVSVLLDTPGLGSAWVPISPQNPDESVQKAWCLWLNSSWTVVQVLAMRSKTLTYPNFSLDQLRKLKLPDPTIVDLDLLSSSFEQVSKLPLKKWREMSTCLVRKQIDDACASAFGLDSREADEIRNLVVEEPTVNTNLAS